MKSVCFYTESREPSGMGRLMLTLAAELRAKYILSFVCPPGSEGLQLLKEAKTLGIKTCALHESKDFDLWLQHNKTDLIHSHAGVSWEGHTGVYTAHNNNIPCVRTEHLPYLITYERQKAEHKLLMEIVDRLVCVSEGAANSFINAGIDRDKLSVVRNGIVLPEVKLTRKETRSKLKSQGLNIVHDTPLFVTIGRFTEQKNHITLLNAIPEVLKFYPKAQWLLIGAGPLFKKINYLVKRRKLTSHVHLLGQRKDVPELMAAADALVLPSLFEGLPLVILEAMALKLPVIGSDVCGIADVVRNDETGRLVQPSDPKVLAAAMCAFIRDPALRAYWSYSAHSHFNQHWTARRMAHDMQKVYDEILNEPCRNYNFSFPQINRGSKKIFA